jgi:site-specific recombinase XerD
MHTFYRFTTGLDFKERLRSPQGNESIETEINKFRNYLLQVRKLSINTANASCSTVKNFLYILFPEKKRWTLEELDFQHVQQYLNENIRHIRPSSKKTMITRLRAYFCFLEFAYDTKPSELLSLPAGMPVWKLSGIPKYLTDDEIALLLSVYDRNVPVGIRDYAIARCFTDLALRCSEIANISLPDINWRDGSICIRSTKTHSERTLPLFQETGQAIEEYLTRTRSLSKERTLFIRFRHEEGQVMGVSQIRGTVRRAAVRAGLENFKGTHMFRHKAGKDMIMSGVGIKSIADVLGHESIETAIIYTKVNCTDLYEVAGNWPEAITNE